MADDPYKILGVSPTASASELRSAYRRLVRLHHPDHNGGSLQSTRRFEKIQEAYAQVRELRAAAGAAGANAGARASAHTQRGGAATWPRTQPAAAPTEPAGPDLDAELAEMERQLREARAARERAMQDARAAAAPESARRATDEELGYVTTDDSFTKIFDDAISELSHWFEERRKPQH